tara:strand:- start:496 stop:762 length:267 start_codon:yes stop_codon:yes gene_type:complete
MDLLETTRVLTRLLEQTKFSLKHNTEKITRTKNQTFKNFQDKLFIEYNEVRVIRITEEIEAITESINIIARTKEFENWKKEHYIYKKP